MRLLNTADLTFREFFDEQTPPYAILSHRWGPQEITYDQFLAGQKKGHDGHVKILEACRIAKANSHQWIWIDTICIQKTSSAELSEAINSMYEYYQRSQVCYAYLEDVPPGRSAQQTSEALQQSEWFTRGWTLQELLAPQNVLFLDSSWNAFGTKNHLASVISKATGIPEWYLVRGDQIQYASIAARMSWCARRKTTRSEDMAYSLLGLFNINMPLLYGERGARAFFRLQLEIAKSSDDESIFAWTSPSNQPCGMFAPSALCFAGFGNIKTLPLDAEDRLPWQYTNKGLVLSLASPLDTRATMSMGNRMFDHTKTGEDHKVVTLGCFKSDVDVDLRDGKAVKKVSKGNIICIELQRIGPRWKRINAQQVLLAKEFERHTSHQFGQPVTQKVYYISQ
ncbi:Putative heterokaryon incompatibility [Septoria linicola]|uniref:Heterokaryon incompatibility n=1 Tax=Septoria linicola TaxID=215465 RepID=A0A9Q9AI13_9PEZI|nr:Putative heterokaryon incompatibility [Septoria linicola]